MKNLSPTGRDRVLEEFNKVITEFKKIMPII